VRVARAAQTLHCNDLHIDYEVIRMKEVLMDSNKCVGLVAAAVASFAACSGALGQSLSTLPSFETRSAIESLPLEPQAGVTEPEFKRYQVDPNKLGSRSKTTLDNQGKPSSPLIVPNTMVLQFVPNASKEGIDSLLRRWKLKVIETFPKLGVVKVEADLNKYFTPDVNDNSANDTLMRGVNKAIEDFKSEPIVQSATPDIALRPQQSSNMNLEAPTQIMSTSDVIALAAAPGSGVLDWGVKDTEADQLWDLPGARDGIVFGVMDVGFTRHEHITFLEFPPKIDVADHGNHVAGIACGSHTSSIGLGGVLPNCFVRARAGRVFLQPTEGGQVVDFLVVFSQILGTMERFFGEYDDVHVFNVSMGYNWEPNFGINPDDPESATYRLWVQNQGAMLVTALELAEKNGKVVFSAAGNDSDGLANPIKAKFASPMNWASLTARETGIAKNGIVVEAHDQSNKRASFSNVGGNISCPGTDILSSIAHDKNGNLSPSSYGKMSGTSMASPYCASAFGLLSLVRPGYSNSELVDCLLASTVKSDTGAPIPRLTQALARCPRRM
jgi:subtilisin family serine protease